MEILVRQTVVMYKIMVIQLIWETGYCKYICHGGN
jgi:hypothetical protein